MNSGLRMININQLNCKLGEIVPFWHDGTDCVIAYIDGDIPIKIKTSLSQEEFDKLCGGK